jgi:hypothetical protein
MNFYMKSHSTARGRGHVRRVDVRGGRVRGGAGGWGWGAGAVWGVGREGVLWTYGAKTLKHRSEAPQRAGTTPGCVV